MFTPVISRHLLELPEHVLDTMVIMRDLSDLET